MRKDNLKRYNRSGFVSFLLVFMLGFVGIAMFTLSAASRKLQMLTRRAELSAMGENIEQSAKNYLLINREEITEGSDDVIELGIEAEGFKESFCVITIEQNDDRISAEIKSVCSIGKHRRVKVSEFYF